MSPDAQRNAVEQYERAHDYTISEWYVDYVSGREAAKRGAFKRLIDDAIAHKFQGKAVARSYDTSLGEASDCMVRASAGSLPHRVVTSVLP